MTTHHQPTPGETALADLVVELTGIATPPAFVDPADLDRVNTAFARVRDHAPDAYRADPSLAGFHFQADYFANPADPNQPALFNTDGGGS